MSEHKDKREQDGGEAAMAELLRLAGPRRPVPRDVEVRVYNRVLGEWQQQNPAPRSARVYDNVRREWMKGKALAWFTRWTLPLAVAASLAVAIALVVRTPPPATVPVPVGTVARVVDPAGRLPAAGAAVYPGDRLVTGEGEALSLLLAGTESVRLDENSVLEIGAPGRFRLAGGRLYADTGDVIYRRNRLVIETSLGSVTDIGTRFAVATGATQLEVAVRDGRVDIDGGASTHTAVAGELLRLASDGGTTIEAITPQSDYWEWAASLAPAFDIENKSLLDFLRWAARETGRDLVFEDPDLRMAAMRTDLHGSVAGFEPLEALASVLATTSYRYHVEATRIVIER